MSKKNNTTGISEKQPAFVTELLKNGTVTLTAQKREDFDTMLADIPADVKYGAGAVGKNPETGIYSLRLDIMNN